MKTNTIFFKISLISLFFLFGGLTACVDKQDDFEVVRQLVTRLVPNQADQFQFEWIKDADTSDGSQVSSQDIFEYETVGDKLVVRGNNPIAITSGIYWYLKYDCHAQVTWNASNLDIPDTLPVVTAKVRKSTDLIKRPYFNYCTYSYSMAWWDWARWEKEIDWMALHGVNMPLLIVGEEAVWQNTLKRMNYNDKEIKEYLSGPGFFAWFFMNNLEGWGGPLPDSWIKDHIVLRHKIQKRMEMYGMKPIFQGFYGMVPSDLQAKYPEAKIQNPGLWCGFRRPSFLIPTDPLFQKMSAIYYEEQAKLYGKASYYAGDPFHEGGNTKGVDLKSAGSSIYKAMKTASADSKWVIQSWQSNPKQELIGHLPKGDVVVLDLLAEDVTNVEDQNNSLSVSKRFGKHDYVWSLILNFGGNVGMYGKMDMLADRVYKSQNLNSSAKMVGIGATPEGIENNPVAFEMLFELPWQKGLLDVSSWLKNYTYSRYGVNNPQVQKAWEIMHNTAYACPQKQQGTTESFFCARPAENIKHVSSWSNATMYYAPKEFEKAWHLMVGSIDQLGNKATFRYDLIDITRQVLANRAYGIYHETIDAYQAKNTQEFEKKSTEFLNLLMMQDRLLNTSPEWMLGTWLEAAKACGHTESEKALYEWNARTQITVWGPRIPADKIGLHEYANKEWAGLLKDFYYPRWKMYFDYLGQKLQGKNPKPIDFFAWEEKWTKKHNLFATQPQEDTMVVVKAIYDTLKK